MNKLFLFACVCAALIVAASAEKTLFVDTVFPSATTATLLEVLTGDNANVEDASVGTLNLNLPDGLVISTEGPVGLEGSFVSIESEISTTVNAAGDIVTDSSDRTSITGTDVEFNVGNDFLLSSRAGRVDLVSHSGFITEADEHFISSDGAVSFNAGSGPIDIFSDDLIEVDAVNTDIFGENRVSIFAQHLLALNAGNNLEVVSDNIDLDALGNLDVTSTNSNVQLIGGNQMIFQADFINVDGERGIDVTSRHGLVQLHGDGASNVSGDNVNLNARQDSTLWAADDLSVIANTFAADALKDVHMRATSLTQSANNFSVDGGEILVNTEQDISITLSGGASDSFTATHHAEIRSSTITLSADDTLSATATDNDLFFSAHQQESSSVNFAAGTSIDISADDLFRARAGTILIGSEDAFLVAGDDLILSTSTGSLDNIELNADTTATFIAGEDTEIAARVTGISAETVTYTAVGSLEFSSGRSSDEVTRIAVDDAFGVSGADVLFHTDGNMDLFVSNELDMEGAGDFSASIYDDISLSVSETVEFDAVTTFSATATRFEALAEEISISGRDVTFSAADEMAFDSAGNLIFNSANLFNWNTARSVQFDAFDEITVDRVSSISGGRILFEGGVATEITGAQTVTTQTNEIEISTDNNGDVNWDGTNLNIQAGIRTEITGIEVNMISAADIEIYGSIDNEDGNVNIATAAGTGHSIAFLATNGVSMSTNQADPLMDAGSIAINSGSTTTLDGFTVSFTADSSITGVIAGPSGFTFGDDLTLASGGDASFTASTGSISFAASSDVTIDIERAITATVANLLEIESTSSTVALASQGSILIDNSAAPATANPDFNMAAGRDIIINAGTFTQIGGDVSTNGGGSSTFSGKERVSFNSYLATEIVADTFLFDASNEGDRIRLEARDFFASADTNDVDLLGGDITFQTGQNQGIFSSAASSLLLETNQLNPFTWQTLDDFNSTAGAYEIVAHNTSDSNIGVRFMSTDSQGDIVVLSRNGEMRLVASEDHTYSADHIELYSAGDMWFTNVLRPSSGGITLQAGGSQYDPYYGDDVGASFRASGEDGFIYILPETGAAHFNANEDIGLVSAAGGLTVDAFDVMPFSTTDGGIELFAHWGTVSITADRNNLTMTTPLDSEVRASANINMRSTDSMRLTAVTDGVLQAVNNIGMEFSVHSGHIEMLADSNEDITWTTPDDYHVQSGDQVSITASDDITFTATNGDFDMHGDTGLGYFVRNGDLQMTASDNIHVTSAENEYINVESGLENNWTAQAGAISITSLDAGDQLETPVDHAADQTGIAMRTERDDVVFQAVDGSIHYLSTGRIQFQSDGTNNNIGGSDVDGIFLVAPEIDSLSTHETIWDAEATVRIGANTNPIVTIEAGGDARANGVTITSEGGANISTQQDFLVTSAGDFGTASVLESDFVVSGDVTISSTGTSPRGRNVDFTTAGELDIDANTVDITGQDSVFVSSAGFLQLTSTGSNPTTAFIDFSAVTDTFINVNGTFDVDVDNWTITTDTLEMLSNGFTSFSNVNGASSGAITVLGDDDLTLVSDVAQSYDSLTGSMNIVTTATNGDIAVEANSETSSVLFYTGGAGEAFGFSMTARDEIDIDTERTLSITARDQDEDDDEEGNITLTTSNDFELFASRDLLIEGAKGLTVSTTNPTGTDIDIESDGFAHIAAWEDMEFRSASDEMTIEAGFDIVFSTNHDQEGSVITTSTRDVVLLAEESSFLDVSGDAHFVGGRTVRWQNTDDTLDFETNAIDAIMSFTAEQGELLIDAGDAVSGHFGTLAMSATGNAELTAVDDIEFLTHGSHSNIIVESEAGTLTIDADSAGFFAEPVLRLVYLDGLEPFGGHGFIEATTSGTHPTDGYGLRIDVVDDADFSAGGHVRMHAPLGTVGITVGEDITLTGDAPLTPGYSDQQNGNTSGGQESLLDGNAVYIAAKGPGGNVNVTSTDDIELSAEIHALVEAGNGIEIDTFFDVNIESNGVTGAEADMTVTSNHPYADLVITATDFLNGIIEFDADDDIDIYGRFGVVLELQDDDDQNSVGEYNIAVDDFFATGRNDVVFTADGGGDIVIDTSDVHFQAGGDLLAEFRNAAEFDIDTNFDIDSFGPVRFDIGEDFSIDVDEAMIVRASGALLSAINDDVTLDGASVSIQVGSSDAVDFQSPSEDLTIRAFDFLDFESDTVTISTARGGSVDFREGLKIPFINSNGTPRSTTAPCNAIGGDESLFYDPYFKQICYCSPNGGNSQLSCQFAYPATYIGP